MTTETEPEIISIAHRREHALLDQLSLYNLGLAAMNRCDVYRAEELRNQQLAQVSMQSA